jgi:hypothetical protein
MADDQNPFVPPTRSALDEKKRNVILAVLAHGNSRRAAARIAGCAPSTITRTIARDPRFAEQVARAEENLDIDLFRSIRNAARDPRYWRAGAWCLERRNPEEFGPRRPLSFTRREAAEFLVQVMDVTFKELPDDQVDAALDRLGELIQGIEDTRAGFPPREEVPPAEPPDVPTIPAMQPPEVEAADEETERLDDLTDKDGAAGASATRPSETV